MTAEVITYGTINYGDRRVSELRARRFIGGDFAGSLFDLLDEFESARRSVPAGA